MTFVHVRAAIHILDWLHRAEADLVGACVTTFNDQSGKILDITLDDAHGLCFTFDSKQWLPVSTIRHRQ